jgi:hypothetical protein
MGGGSEPSTNTYATPDATSKRVSEGALADALGYEKLVAQPLTQFIASFYIHGNAFDRHVATSYELLYP